MPSYLSARAATGAPTASFANDIRAFLLLRASGVCLLALTLLLGGCASSADQRSSVAGPTPAAAAYPRQHTENLAMKIEVEADGLPAQLALRNRPHLPDDPTEPWSPNYGSVHPGDRAAAPAPSAARTPRPTPVVAAARPPRYLMASRPLDPDEVIRRAIAEHEIRRNR